MNERYFTIAVDEFTAPLLLELVEEELARLKASQAVHRDAFEPVRWASISLDISGMHTVWRALHFGINHDGEASREAREWRAEALKQLSLRIPRSKANSIAWRAAKAAEKARLEELKARKPITKRKAW